MCIPSCALLSSLPYLPLTGASMTRGHLKGIAAAVFSVFVGTQAFAQGSSTASISGVVVDAQGAVIPGADVVVKNDRTGEVFAAVSSAQGVFSIPALITGTYTVTVSLAGFKSVVLNNVI